MTYQVKNDRFETGKYNCPFCFRLHERKIRSMKIESAGGVVFRQRDHIIQILLIQDRFGYWTFPKGKKEKNETDEETALREIAEETQLKGKILKKLTQIVYNYPAPNNTIQKRVTFFLVESHDGLTKAQASEIRAVRWFTIEEAEKILTDKGYDNQRPVLLFAKQEINQLFCDKP